MRSIVLRLTGLAFVALAAAPASASAALTVSDARIGSHPAYVRVVVDFTGGTLGTSDDVATDPAPADGSARVDVNHRAIRVRALDRSASGVRVRVSLAGVNRASVRLTSTAGRFKYLDVALLHSPERLVIDLYRSAPPSAAAEIRTGERSCLTLTSVRGSTGSFNVRGSERELFEGSFVLRVRDASGRVVGRRIVTARGPWTQTLRYVVSRAQAGTVEAVASSAKDGSLDCLVQVRVALVR